MHSRLTILALLVTVAVSTAAPLFRWDSCGSKDDRLYTTQLNMSAPEGAWGKGYRATVKGSGDSNLHGPLLVVHGLYVYTSWASVILFRRTLVIY